MMSLARIQHHVDDIAHRVANIEVTYNALTATFDPIEQSEGFAELRRQIERARLYAEGLAAALREP